MRMKFLFATLLLAIPAGATAQSSQPHKLILLHGQEGLAITDYPSAARCEMARVAIERLVEAENRNTEPRQLPGGGVIFPWALSLRAYCIPG